METINITVKIPTHEVAKFQRWIDDQVGQHAEVVDFKILPNTQKMYEADDHFKKLTKIKKQGKVAVEKYINDNNNKYINK